MKSFTKALVLAPIFLLSLTACGKISEDQAKERVKGYNAAEVAEKYASYDIKGEAKVTKRSGVFAEGGLMASIADTLIEAFNTDEKGNDVAGGIFTTGSLDIGSADQVEMTYYAYKKTGLKVVANIDADETTEGMSEKVKGKETIYVLDDGRIEKGDGNMSMTVSGSYAGINLEGELAFTFKMSYKWNAK